MAKLSCSSHLREILAFASQCLLGTAPASPLDVQRGTRQRALAKRPIVVLADDDEDGRTLLTSAVRGEGFRVYEAGDGSALVTCVERLLARGEQVSLVLSDINMPERDGIEATEQLHEIDSSLRVVLMSAFASAGVVRSALHAGAEQVLRKPLALGVLLALLPAVK